MLQRIKSILFSMLSMILIAGCTGLAGEPEIVRTLPAPPSPIPELNVSLDAPVSLEAGAALYAANCARCHGITGAGDGEFVTSGQIGMISDFTDPQTTSDQSLQTWFNTITNGRLENLMPPWRNALTAEERWAVALYTYTMPYTDAAITQGAALYEAECSTCHAPDGSADGPSLVGLANYSEASLEGMVSTHLVELDADALSEADLSAVTQYTRLLSATSQQLPDPQAITLQGAPDTPLATEEVVQAATTPQAIPETSGVLRGQVIQGTPGGSSIEGAEAVVHIYDSRLQEQIAEYTVGADGRYQYEGVRIRPDFAYRMTVQHQGMMFSSPIVLGDPSQDEIVLDVTVYDPGAEASDLTMTSRATQFNLTSRGLYVIEVINLVNNSDRAYMREGVAGITEPVSAAFAIPNDASLQPDHTDPNRIILSEDGRTVADVWPILPNIEHYIQYGYLLPIGEARTVTQPVPYDVSGPIAFFVEDSHLQFAGDNIAFLQRREFNGQTYSVYEVVGTPQSGDTMIYDLSLRTDPRISTEQPSNVVPREVLALVLVVVGALIVVVAALFVWRSRRDTPEPMPVPVSNEIVTSEVLIKQIANLDSAYEAGQIAKGDYDRQRAQLKAQLVQIMKDEQ